MAELNIKPRTIFCHDNLEILRGLNSDCIELIYLDPPFNKNKVFTAPIGSSAEGAEFSDIFREEDVKDEWVDSIRFENPELHEYLGGVKTFSNKYNYCYLVYMAIRLMECHRVLKDTGSIYLHCDPTMGHHLKITLDCIFGEANFRKEIIWNLQTASGYKSQIKGYIRGHDTILYYSKSGDFVFNKEYLPHKDEYVDRFKHTDKDGRRYRDDRSGDRRQYLDTTKGVALTDVWSDIMSFQQMATASEKVGYPTQKPLALLRRIVKASSNPGDVVLDPFCGCATTCIAAELEGRQWIGIDVSVKAFEVVKSRLSKEVAADMLRDEPNFSTVPPRQTEGGEAHAEQGYVYVIANENWKDIYKVGIAKDVERRLNSYQTSDPFRAYKLAYKIKTPHFREVERHIHAKFNGDHEWVSGDLEAIKREIDAAAKAADK